MPDPSVHRADEVQPPEARADVAPAVDEPTPASDDRDDPIADAELLEDEDEALAWAGDAERGRDSRSSGSASDDDEDDDEAPVRARAEIQRPGTTADLIARVVFGLIAIAAAAGWIVVATQNPVEQPSLLGIIMYQLGEFLSIIAAPLGWVVVDRTLSTSRSRLIGWVIAAVATAPWPLLIGALA